MANFTGTSGNDVINATYGAGFTWGDQVRGEGGDDRVTLSPGVAFVSGPGNDTITGDGGGAYAYWGLTGSVVIDLAQGWAQDGYGGTDQLSGITELHLPGGGATVTGSALDETVFYFGGNAVMDMGAGTDKVMMWQIDSSAYTIRQSGNAVVLTSAGRTIELRNVERIEFADRTIETPVRGSAPYFGFRYDIHSFTETEQSPGWTYAGVYYPPQLVSYFPQAVSPFDIGADGDADLVIPMNRGYRTGVDTRFHFQTFENVGGRLTYNAAMTEATPFIAGSRRVESIHLDRFGGDALVTVAHDTAIETETRYDIPWRYGDISVLRGSPFTDVTAELVPPGTLPKSLLTGRSTAVDAHSMAVGDLNGDGMDDILVGEFSGPYVLLQTAAGNFSYRTDSFLQSLATNWREPTLANATQALLIDLHLADLNGDGHDDLVAGWGHATVLGRVFYNDGLGTFSLAASTPLPASVYGASNSLHMKTFSADFDRDGDVDLVVLQSRYEPYYGGNYLQFLQNDGTGHFTDATAARLGDPQSSPDTFAERLHWTDFWQVIDVNGDGALDIAGHRVTGPLSTPVVYLNDGAGRFSRVEAPTSARGGPISWSDFDGDGRIEIVNFSSGWNDAAGTSSTNTFSVYEWTVDNPAHSRAFDLQGAAGTVAKVLGAVFGPASVSNAVYAGIGLSLVDSGTSYEALMNLALGVALPGARSNEDVVRLLHTNVVGTAPSAETQAYFAGLIAGGQYTQASLAMLAADHALNLAHIDLVGLTRSGLEYLPHG